MTLPFARKRESNIPLMLIALGTCRRKKSPYPGGHGLKQTLVGGREKRPIKNELQVLQRTAACHMGGSLFLCSRVGANANSVRQVALTYRRHGRSPNFYALDFVRMRT